MNYFVSMSQTTICPRIVVVREPVRPVKWHMHDARIEARMMMMHACHHARAMHAHVIMPHACGTRV